MNQLTYLLTGRPHPVPVIDTPKRNASPAPYDARAKTLDAISVLGGDVTAIDLADYFGVTQPVIYKRLKRMLEDGTVCKTTRLERGRVTSYYRGVG